MNKLKLESIMKLKGHTGQYVADKLGISRSTFSAKLNEKNGAEFTQGEITKLKNEYELTPQEIDEIFFKEKVS